jgi:RNA polymerase sigma-70 factor (ECF subfamily)
MTADPSQRDITLLLQDVGMGAAGAVDRLIEVVHQELTRMAAGHLRDRYGDRVGQITLEPAALVNESFLRLIHQRNTFDNRGHFFAIATKVMLRVLSDYQRQRMALKRGGSRPRTLLSVHHAAPDTTEAFTAVEVDSLIAALERLQAVDERKADIIRMRIVWGMTVPMIADALGVSASSIDREWRFAKAWIASEMVGECSDPSPGEKT